MSQGDDFSGDLPPIDPDLAAWLASDQPTAIPADVWTRLEARLAAEPALAPSAPPEAGESAENVVSDPIDLAAERARRRGGRVLPILAGAAGLAIVGAVVLPSLRSADPAPVADGAPASQPLVVAKSSPSPDMVASAPTAAMPRMMMSTGTDYASAQMTDQVQPLLETAGLADAAAVETMSSTLPTDLAPVGTSGFTSSPESLADCMGRLGMTSDGPPALVVDRATFDGADVGVVVTVNTLPASAGEPAVLDVIVVGSACSETDVAAAQRFEYAVTP